MSDAPLSLPPGTTDAGGAQRMLTILERAVDGTPYRVVRTQQGFQLSLDVASAGRPGGPSATGIRVRQREIATATVVDTVCALRWHGLVRTRETTPREDARASVWGIRDDGTLGPVLDLRFDSAEAHDLVEAAAGAAGLTVVRGGAERGAIVAAWVGGAVALLGIVVAIVVTLALA